MTDCSYFNIFIILYKRKNTNLFNSVITSANLLYSQLAMGGDKTHNTNTLCHTLTYETVTTTINKSGGRWHDS